MNQFFFKRRIKCKCDKLSHKIHPFHDIMNKLCLWERLWYRVVGTKIIEPHEIENILIQPGRDMVTLLTCHPYASGGKQRYLVYCQRIPEYDIMEVPYD